MHTVLAITWAEAKATPVNLCMETETFGADRQAFWTHTNQVFPHLLPASEETVCF